MDRTTVYSYPKAWKLENKIYAIGNYKLIVPLYPRQILYFVTVLLCMLGLSELPPVSSVPWVIRFVVIPFVVGNYLLKKKLDGKSPVKYFLSWLQFCSQRGRYLERFCLCPTKKAKENIRWYCVRGTKKLETGGEDDLRVPH